MVLYCFDINCSTLTVNVFHYFSDIGTMLLRGWPAINLLSMGFKDDLTVQWPTNTALSCNTDSLLSAAAFNISIYNCNCLSVILSLGQCTVVCCPDLVFTLSQIHCQYSNEVWVLTMYLLPFIVRYFHYSLIASWCNLSFNDSLVCVIVQILADSLINIILIITTLISACNRWCAMLKTREVYAPVATVTSSG